MFGIDKLSTHGYVEYFDFNSKNIFIEIAQHSYKYSALTEKQKTVSSHLSYLHSMSKTDDRSLI